MTTIIGIDPGKAGGIASVNDAGQVIAMPMPPTTRDLYDYLDYLDSLCDSQACAFVEQVNAGPSMGSSAAFKFGEIVGEIHMACIATGLSTHYVSPMKWQRELGLLCKGRGLGQGDTAKKNRNKAKAQELFPGIKITHAIADALLLVEYGRRVLAKLH